VDIRSSVAAEDGMGCAWTRERERASDAEDERMTSFWNKLAATSLLLTCAGLALAASPNLGGGDGASLDERDTEGVVLEQNDDFDFLPAQVGLNALIRDFRASGVEGGHQDFERFNGGGVTVGLVQPMLGDDGKPVLADLNGKSIVEQFRDSKGREINPAHFNEDLGDSEGELRTRTSPQITSASTFAQWYNDIPGVNASKSVELVLHRAPGSNVYVMDSQTQAPWTSNGGFFPINGDLFGNFGSTNRNFHFTTQIEADFTFERGKGQVFSFAGDDDVWVFIDGKLVIDLGGLHSVERQTVELDRLDWLNDGQSYRFKIFHAERRTNASNFRMETTLLFRSVGVPQTTALFD
jgi:fibro-slime domain-containing protein